jgi:SEC-C motif
MAMPRADAPSSLYRGGAYAVPGMPIVPAICDHCGSVFSSGIVMGGTSSAAMTGNAAGPCPNCGSRGTIPDGLYQTFGDTLQILATSPRSATSLERLAAVLRAAREQGKDMEATAAAIESEAPEFAGLAGGLRQVKGWTLYQWVAILLALITVLISSRNTGCLTTQQVEQLFDEFVQSHPVLAHSPPVSPTEAGAQATPSAPHPNDPCPCGSGNRYRHCHGVRALRRQ